MKISVRRSRKWISQKNYLCRVVHILLAINFSDQFISIFFCLRFNIMATETRTHARTQSPTHTRTHAHTQNVTFLERSDLYFKSVFSFQSSTSGDESDSPPPVQGTWSKFNFFIRKTT